MLTDRQSTPTFGLILSVIVTVCFLPAFLPGVKIQVVSAAAADTTELRPGGKGSELTPRGKWSETVTYNRDDLVTSRGSTWRSKHDNNLGRVPGQTNPSTATDWQAFSVGFNPLGAWLISTTYHPNDVVTHIGSTWRAMRTNVNKVPGLAPDTWEQFAAKGAAGPPGSNSAGSGSVTSPSFSFKGDSDTGIFSPEAGRIALVGDGTLFLHNLGSSNLALGTAALESYTGASFGTGNTALGHVALQAHTTGHQNTAAGAAALLQNTTGDYNTAIGAWSLLKNTDGNSNIALGRRAGWNSTASSNSIFVGNEGLAGDTATIKIGREGIQTTAFIAGISGVTVANSAAVLINTSTGQLGTISSSRRYKEDI